MTLQHLKNTLALVFALMIGTVIMHELHIAPWPAFLAAIFYFHSEFDNSTIKSIMGSGIVGLMFGYAFTFAMPWLVEHYGSYIGHYILIGVSLLIVIGMKPVAHAYFNPMTFTYGLLSLLFIQDAGSQTTIWLATHIFAGGFIIGCLYLTVYRVIPKYLT